MILIYPPQLHTSKCVSIRIHGNAYKICWSFHSREEYKIRNKKKHTNRQWTDHDDDFVDDDDHYSTPLKCLPLLAKEFFGIRVNSSLASSLICCCSSTSSPILFIEFGSSSKKYSNESSQNNLELMESIIITDVHEGHSLPSPSSVQYNIVLYDRCRRPVATILFSSTTVSVCLHEWVW